MISQSKFHLNFQECDTFIEKLNEPVFLKTELDVVQDDFVRWEINNLLWIDVNSEKGNSQRRYSCLEYTWVKLVEQLRFYGFEYDRIQGYRAYLKQLIDTEALIESGGKGKEKLLDFLPEDEIDAFLENKDKQDYSEILNITLLESFIINTFIYNDLVSILFYHDMPGFCFIASREIYKVLENEEGNSGVIEILNSTHLSISLTEIVGKFAIKDMDTAAKIEKVTSILSDEEHNILKIVRKKYKNIRSIKIRFESDQMKLLEVKTLKKATLESRLLEYIKKGDYSNIQIDSVNGKIVNFENTQKYKL